jgi:hypothetical protein
MAQSLTHRRRARRSFSHLAWCLGADLYFEQLFHPSTRTAADVRLGWNMGNCWIHLGHIIFLDAVWGKEGKASTDHIAESNSR